MDSMIPVKDAIMMLTLAKDTFVSAKDLGHCLRIESLQIGSSRTRPAPVEVAIANRSGNRYVSAAAVESALRKMGEWS